MASPWNAHATDSTCLVQAANIAATLGRARHEASVAAAAAARARAQGFSVERARAEAAAAAARRAADEDAHARRRAAEQAALAGALAQVFSHVVMVVQRSDTHCSC